jgi:penicillin amidase
VSAATEADMYRGLGWWHGRDRPLQMLLTRLAGRGRLAEHLGDDEDLVATDIAFRRLDLAGDAAAEAERIAPEDRALVDAYCDGAAQALTSVPWELRAAGLREVEPWTAADCILLARMAGWVTLAQSQGEMERLLVDLVRAGVGDELLEELFPGELGGLDAELLRRLEPGEPLVPAAVRWNVALPRPLASNNWVIAGARTASGRAVLANDPHLEVGRLPNVWSEIGLRAGDRWGLGATMPGIPGLLVGRTNDLAWGATYAFMDATDVWVEDCRDGARRRLSADGETWEPLPERRETIHRRGAAPLEVTFHESPGHGVLDGDPREPGLRLATRWSSASGTGAASLGGILALFRASGVEQGRAAAGRLELGFNWVLADRDGHIGYQMSGLLPLRREGVSGLVPLPGWDPRNDWRGFAPPEDLPRALDPPEGFLVTANQDLSALGRRDPHTVAMDPSRADRITERLSARGEGWDVAACLDVQRDLRSPHAAAYLDVLRPLLPAGRNGELLAEWDATYATDSVAATLFERFRRELLLEVFGRVLGREPVLHLLDETGILADFYTVFDRVLLAERSAWFGGRTREEIWRRAALRALAGPARPWGDVQQVTLRHLLLGGRLPMSAGFDRGPLPLPGGAGSPSQGQVYRSGGRETSFAPSLRLITDFAEEAVHTALAGGPSDRRFSRWYVSGLADWAAGRLTRHSPPPPGQ